MRADVNGLMQGELGDWLAGQAEVRFAAKKQAIDRWTWGVALMMPTMAFVWFAPWFDGWRFMLFAAGMMGMSWWGYLPIAKAKRSIKIGINSGIAKSLGITYEHDVEPGAEFAAAKRYGLVPRHDRDSFEDHWHGSLEGHEFGLYEAHLEVRRGSGKNRRWETVFRGVIVRMRFGRDFGSSTLLQRAGRHKTWFGLGGKKNSVDFGGHALAYVDQVHPAFEDVFDLYSDDAVEARVLVHPAYVEHLVALEKAFHGKAVRALFAKGEVIVAVEQRENLFESGSMDPEKDRLLAEETADQFAALARLALSINQNERGRVIANETRPTPLPREDAAQFAKRRAGGGFGRKGL
ncbi:Protein of unknown function (DUF3137) [Erythrobacter litoralis]|uniref:DUF3137 domain-containing protein n=1 Tax=Erythrobacter litoralis TaxID=39960 RepID=A0A074N1A9_9SPHN|nr:DUF3137 domain-containing protein [Erythrobacter litoralis]AOL23796.1 Protein of unknown function (DUF3137) [Erythrobacter litoralis]KEO98720.1 hypothetical protein EH32_06335 [Erythrobacter litoralis]